MLTYAVGRSARRERDAATLILAGVTVTAFFTAWQTFVQQQNSETLQEVYSWILGNIPSTGWSDVVLILPYVAVAIVVILALRRVVDVLNLGDDEAASLGVDVRRVRLALVVAATLGTAAAVAVTGLIGFVGIIVPHTIRLLTGVGYRALLPLSVIVGAGFLVLADVVARTALSPGGDPARGRHRVLRRAVLRARPAHDARGRMSAIELRGVTVELGGRPVVDSRRRRGRAGRVGRAHRPERRGQDDAPARDRAARPVLAARSRSAGARAPELARVGARAARRGRPAGAVDPAVDDGRRVRPARPDAAPRAARRRRARATATRRHARSRGSISSRSSSGGSGTLSGGEKQRVVVARALAQEASIVLLDEPTAALDIGHQQQALDLLDGLRAESGLTLVAAMHDLTLAAQYADRMLLLNARPRGRGRRRRWTC